MAHEIAPECEGFAADLSALLDDELAGARAALVRAHVAACAACRSRLAGLARVDVALAGAPVRAVPASLRARLEARLAGEGTGRVPADTSLRHTSAPRAARRPWRAAGAALAAAAASVVLYVALATREPARAPLELARPSLPAPPPEAAPAPVLEPAAQLARREPAPPPPPPAPAARERAVPAPEPQSVARREEPAPPALDLDAVSDEELDLALELDALDDLDVIANLEALERLVAEEG